MNDSSTTKQANGAAASAASGNGAPAEGARQFTLRRFYVKDVSFEAPNSPGIFSESGLDPEMKVNLRTSHRKLGDGMSEVVLHVSVHAIAGERTVFLVELQQAGAFQVTGFPPDEARAILGVACPTALFPYAREAISSIVQRGGFAPILLQPIDFAVLFAQAQASRAANPARRTRRRSPSGVLPMTPAADFAPIAVLGAGSWGTALAMQLARGGQPVTLWGRNAAHLQNIASQRVNRQYLPGIDLPAGVRTDADLGRVVGSHRDLLVCVPSHAFRSTLVAVRRDLKPGTRLAWATKGFEDSTGRLPHEVAAEELGAGVPVAVLSGPTFAREVAAGLPTAMTVAASDPGYAGALAARLSDHTFRAYTSDDMIGVEVGGAVKNVLAIGAGISDGLGFGANTRIALITRGLVEMTRLGVALGARATTFMGLSGMGDLVLTCTDDQSRNRRFGLAIARGEVPAEAARNIGQVVEGRFAAGAVRTVAARRQLEMPICEQVYRVLEENVAPQEAVMALMARALKPE